MCPWTVFKKTITTNEKLSKNNSSLQTKHWFLAFGISSSSHKRIFLDFKVYCATYHVV